MYLPRSVSFAVSDLQHLLVPLYLISAVALVELSYRVAEAATAPAWRLSTAAIRAVLVIVIAVKLSQRLLGRSGQWVTYVKEQRSAAVQAVLALLFFLVAAWVFRALRGRRREAEGTTEGLVYAGSFLVALPLLVTSVTLGVGSFLLHLGGGPGAAQWVLRNYPQGECSSAAIW